jgi:MFS family permease
MAASAMGAHLVPLLLERGLTPGLAAAAAGLVGLMQLGGRLFFTLLASRVPLLILSTLTFALHALALLVLLAFSGLAGVWGFATLFGLSNGAITLARAALLTEIFGPRSYGQLKGVIALVTAFSGAAAPLLAGVLHGVSGGYGAVLALLTLTTVLSALAVAQVRAPRAALTRG